MATAILKPRHDDFLKHRHPWVFSGAVGRVEGAVAPGETIDVRTHDGVFLGRGSFSPRSQIRVRMWAFDDGVEIDETFFRCRLQRAIEARKGGGPEPGTRGVRLVYSESDGLPGVIVDRYGDFLVCQFLAAGAEYWRSTLVELLDTLAPNAGIFERSDVDVRGQEGLPKRAGVLRGDAPPERILIEEGACRYLVDVREGHKTGFYLDQSENRRQVSCYTQGAEVLDGFCYTGGFSVAALRSGAGKLVSVDSSAAALRLARANLDQNGIDPSRTELVQARVSELLRTYRDSRRQFDAIILDPPKFVHAQSHLRQAARGYKDINMLALKLLRAGGVLVTFSCSQGMTPELFRKVVAGAALDARRDVQILQVLQQAPDHPVAMNFPEAAYLKGLVCRAW